LFFRCFWYRTWRFNKTVQVTDLAGVLPSIGAKIRFKSYRKSFFQY
jgi:hypothetical protein